MQGLEELLSAGYEVRFSSPVKDEYEASVTSPSGDDDTGYGPSAGAALWDASPLHAPDAAYPGEPVTDEQFTKVMIAAWQDGVAAGRIEALEKRVTALETGPIDAGRVVVEVPACGAEGPPELAGYRCRLPERHGGDEHKAAGCSWWVNPAVAADREARWLLAYIQGSAPEVYARAVAARAEVEADTATTPGA